MQTLLEINTWLQSCEEFVNAKNKNSEHCFCHYLKNNIADIRLIPLDHVTYYSFNPIGNYKRSG